MNVTNFAKWEVEYDAQATRKAYASIGRSDEEMCGYDVYRNFILARNQGKVFPPVALSLFEVLGVNPNKEGQVTHYGRVASGLHSYGGWFHFVGRIISGEDAKRQVSKNAWLFDMAPIEDHFTMGFTACVDLLEDVFDAYPIVQLEFTAELPWLLDTPEPE